MRSTRRFKDYFFANLLGKKDIVVEGFVTISRALERH